MLKGLNLSPLPPCACSACPPCPERCCGTMGRERAHRVRKTSSSAVSPTTPATPAVRRSRGTWVAAAAMPAVAGRPITRPPVTLPTVSSWPATTIRSSSARPATAWRMRSMAKRTLAGCLPPAILARARWSPRPAWNRRDPIRRARRGHHRIGTRVRLPVKRRQVAAVECGGFLQGTSVLRTVTVAQFAQARPLQAPAHHPPTQAATAAG